MAKIIGIDLGTTNTVIAITSDEARFEPEVVEIDGKPGVGTVLRLSEDGESIELFGGEAWDRSEEATERTYFEFKVEMGTEREFKAPGGKTFTARELAVIFLRHLRLRIERQYFNGVPLMKQDVRSVIGYPSAWNERQKEETILAAEEAGFPCVVGCEEPLGAVYYHHYKGELSIAEDKTLAVYDFGGGTTDVSIVKTSPSQRPSVVATGGNLIGGRNYDQAIATELGKGLSAVLGEGGELSSKGERVIKRTARLLKEKLSNNIYDNKDSAEVTVLLPELRKTERFRLSKESFTKWCEALITDLTTPLWDVLGKCGLNPEEINTGILTGGSSRLFFVRDDFKTVLKETEIVSSLNPEGNVAKGLAIYGRFLPVCDLEESTIPQMEQEAGPKIQIEEGPKLRVIPRTPKKTGKTSPKKIGIIVAVFSVIVLALFLMNGIKTNPEEVAAAADSKQLVEKRPLTIEEKYTQRFDEMSSLCRRYMPSINGDQNSINTTTTISEKKLRNAIEKFHIPYSEVDSILFVYDDTTFGSNKRGFAVTERGIYKKEVLEDPVFIDWNTMIRSYPLKHDKDTIYISGHELTVIWGEIDKMNELLNRVIVIMRR